MNPSFDKQVSDCGISYYQHGNGPCLLLIHGVGLKAESWYRYIKPLSDHYNLIIVDLPGHGDSLPLTDNYEEATLDSYTHAISHFLTNTIQQSFYVCGHSLGSLIAIELAAKQDNKALGVAALNAIHNRGDDAHHAVQARAKQLHESQIVIGVQQTIERWFGKNPTAELQTYASLCEHWLRNSNLNGYAMAYKIFADQRGPNTQTLKSIPCPSLYMTGDLDFNSSPKMTRALADLSSNKSKSVIVENAGHMMPLTHTELVCRELLNFIRQ